MDELKRVTEVLATMSEAERVQVLRLTDGPLRRQSQERASEFNSSNNEPIRHPSSTTTVETSRPTHSPD